MGTAREVSVRHDAIHVVIDISLYDLPRLTEFRKTGEQLSVFLNEVINKGLGSRSAL